MTRLLIPDLLCRQTISIHDTIYVRKMGSFIWSLWCHRLKHLLYHHNLIQDTILKSQLLPWDLIAKFPWQILCDKFQNDMNIQNIDLTLSRFREISWKVILWSFEQTLRNTPGLLLVHHKRKAHIEGILPKGPYLPCVSMAGRALLAGYPRYHDCEHWSIMQNICIVVTLTKLYTPDCSG